MKAFKIATVLPWLLIVAGVLSAATQYGEAVIEQGAMTIVREGQTLRFDEANQPIPVNEQDLLRVAEGSQVTLTSREKATVTLGSNAVFHVKPWRSREKSGFLRGLFGKFRAAVVGLVGGEEFNVKTATATIGVKGTEYLTSVTSRGSTMLVVTDDDPEFTGQFGPPVDVNAGQLSLVININPPTPPVPTPPGVERAFNVNNLGSPPPNSPQGKNLPAEDTLVDEGIVSEDDLDEGKGDDAFGDRPPRFQTPALNFDPNAASNALRRARVPLRFASP